MNLNKLDLPKLVREWNALDSGEADAAYAALLESEKDLTLEEKKARYSERELPTMPHFFTLTDTPGEYTFVYAESGVSAIIGLYPTNALLSLRSDTGWYDGSGDIDLTPSAEEFPDTVEEAFAAVF